MSVDPTLYAADDLASIYIQGEGGRKRERGQPITRDDFVRWYFEHDPNNADATISERAWEIVRYELGADEKGAL